jgi:hypothetical protein
MTEKELRRAIEELLAAQSDNQRLRDNLEGLCRDPLFPGLTWFWGPRLYARGKALYRVLALPDARARALAADNIEILLGTLLRPLHRKTRMAAFDALANAARHSEMVAQRVHARAREALKLPDKKYPKAELIGLIARTLAAHPVLAAEAERPVVYRHAKAAA